MSQSRAGTPARSSRYRYGDGGGEIGVIASVTQPFCRGCTRARLSADGKLYTCLFAGTGHDLRGPLRRGDSDQALGEQVAGIWARRADRYSELRTLQTGRAQQVKRKVENVAHRRLASRPVTGEGLRRRPGGQESPRRWSRP